MTFQGGNETYPGAMAANVFIRRIKNFVGKKPGRSAFWAWIAYQSIKGTITLSLIWIPLLLLWLGRS